MKIARVIVDVPASNVNQTFDYEIPNKYQGIVKRGVRVVIPFGRRKITGFVIELLTESPYAPLKPILEVLDVTPVLTDELLQLGKWLAEETVSLYITTYQAMLPQVFKATYKKLITWDQQQPLPDELKALFTKQDTYDFSELIRLNVHLGSLQAAIENGILTLTYHVTTRERKQYETIYIPESKEVLLAALEKLPANAHRQKAILQFFLTHHEPIEQKKLYARLQINNHHVKSLLAKKLLRSEKKEVYRNPYQKPITRYQAHRLTEEQQVAYEKITAAVKANRAETFLLHGITGSGKTEVYLQVIADVLKLGKEAIVLVPEISLTPQMVERFKARFGDKVAVLHSALSTGEKYDEWRKIQRKEVQVVVGARSAIFAPFENLGVIIIDEEHETSYKQEEAPRYHAKDVAIKRGEYNACPVVLGSATPTLEAYARAKRNVYQLLELTKRTNEKPLPNVAVVDMREELRFGNRSMFSRLLLEKIEDRLAKGEQIVLLLNRRGYSTFALCRECGYVEQCPSCDISLTYHKHDNKLKCHYCLYETNLASTCPKCQSNTFHFFGTGTERVEEALLTTLPHARVIRMDVDTTRKKGAHERLLTQFQKHEADILLGTQMIAKGLDFANVTLVGVLNADSMLHLPDFRAAERTFQLITQVSGRAGRHELIGEVVVQTYAPEHYSIVLASKYDYHNFFLQEMKMRKTFRYPPYVFLALLTFAHEQKAFVYQAAAEAAHKLQQFLSKEAILLGPTPSPIARLKNRYRYQIMLKYRQEPQLLHGLETILEHFAEQRRQGLQITIDMNPYQFM